MMQARQSSDLLLGLLGIHAPALRFALIFGALMALYYFLALLPFVDRELYGYLCANAWCAGKILHWLGQATSVTSTTIQSANYAINVQRGCDALEPTWFFCAAVLAFPSNQKSKFFGMLAGAALIISANLLRIVSLYLVGRYAPNFFNSAHLEVWPALFVLLAVGLWLGWINWSGN